MADRVTFTPGSAERIAKVVRIVEAGNRDTGWRPPAPRTVGGGGGGAAVRLCTFTGSWSVGGAKTVTIAGSTNTLSVTNHYLGLNPDSDCTILAARAGTAWYLAQADLSGQPNYNASAGTQVFTIASGGMEWADVSSCDESQASSQALSFFSG